MMKFEQIPSIEQNAVHLLVSAPGIPGELSDQLDHSTEVERTFNEVGGYVDFRVSCHAKPLAGSPNFHIADLAATNALGQSMEFVIFVCDGFLATLEIYTADAALPEYEGLILEEPSRVRMYAYE